MSSAITAHVAYQSARTEGKLARLKYLKSPEGRSPERSEGEGQVLLPQAERHRFL
jgi:hypothetical protein